MVAELVLAITIILLAFLAPSVGRSFFERVEKSTATLAHDRLGQILAVGLFALVARAAFLPWLGPPVPIGYDENSLVLQAQTFIAGRLANPTPALWEHFEGIYVNVRPAYASMYFPGRGLPLAAGLLLADNIWIGVWLSFILMSMASVWMLQGWVSRPLALLGGVLVVLRLGVFSYWVNSYQGGAFSALGGMLVLGAVPRILREPGWRNGLALAVGAFFLLITRPFEGALLCVPLGIFMLMAVLRAKAYPFTRLAARVALPVVALCAVGGGILIAHNKAATGDPLNAPYALNRETYAITPAFLTASRVDGEQRGPAYFRKYFEVEDRSYALRSNPVQVALGIFAKLYDSWNFYVGFILSLGFLAGLWTVRKQYILTGTLIAFFIGYFLETWNFPHYTSPIYSVFLIILVKGFARLRGWRFRQRDVGLFLTRAMPFASLLVLAMPAASVIAGWPALENNRHNRPCCALAQNTVRARIAAKLEAMPGRDLVMVASDMRHPIHEAILYNDPDIGASEIVWAHKLDPRKDAALQALYSGRNVWDLDWADDGTPRLRPLDRLRGLTSASTDAGRIDPGEKRQR